MSIGPITSPYFLQGTPWPYIKGPNYTRPVFGENTRNGAFMLSPLVRMPSLRGFGDDPVAALPATPPAATPAASTPELVCDSVKPAGTVPYAQCLKWNTDLMATIAASDNSGLTKKNNSMDAADKKCGALKDFNAWAACYYGALEAPWYTNPLYLGGMIVGGAVVLGLITRYIRAQQGY